MIVICRRNRLKFGEWRCQLTAPIWTVSIWRSCGCWQTEGRITAVELARRIGLSKSPTQARMKRLEEAGVITGYRAMLDPIRMGQAHVAFVEVRLSDTREAALQAFNRAVLAVPEVEQCHMIASELRLSAEGAHRPISRPIAACWASVIRRLPHVASTSTYVAMEAVKDGGA